MSPVIYNVNNAVHREKMAAFDYDWTLVSPRSEEHTSELQSRV